MAKVNITDSPLFQSGYTYLQAVGSDGSDGTVPGAHLKWDFLRSLGENHLPKGSLSESGLYSTNIGFNRKEDFVKIYKFAFNENSYYVDLDAKSVPGSKTLINGKWVWEYTLPVSGGTGTTSVQLIFSNTGAYTTLSATLNPNGNESSFIGAYPALLEVRMVDKLFFYCAFTAVKNNASLPFYIRAEAIGRPDSGEMQQHQLNVRKSFTDPTQPMKFLSENTEYVRFDLKNAASLHIRLIAYEDLIRGVNDASRDGSWQQVGAFSLTLSDSEMQTRFLPDYVDGAGGHWPKFNDANAASRFVVNKGNYYQRWRANGYSFNPTNPSANDQNGLQHFIHTYLSRSVLDTKAVVDLPSDDEHDETYQTISCLEMLRLVSLDYHVSRIMGMGHIDRGNESNTNQWVYCMEYITSAALEKTGDLNIPKDRSHLYLSLPTSRTDYRLPAVPKLDECTFGATVDNGTDTPTELTNAEGYAPQENLRFININRKPYQHEKPVGPFFNDASQFSLADETQPVAYGLEYKEISELVYRAPELSHDSVYKDYDNIPETMPILENGGPRLYTHQEEEEGTHEYAAYAINWFSRVSGLSNTREVTTVFPKISRLLPPFNFATQLIQDEDPSEPAINDKVLVLTTAAEQEKLRDIPQAQDHTLVRTTFDWNHVHNHAHPTVDYAEFFFRNHEPLVVKGKISSVTAINSEQAWVNTTSYSVTSSFPAETVQPNISTADSDRFVGSLFSTGQTHYVIDAVQSTGNNPKFLVRVLKQTQAMAPVDGNQNQFISMESVELPQAGDLFFVVENTADPSNWDLLHRSRIYLEKHYSNTTIGLRYSPTLLVKYNMDAVYDVNASSKTWINTYESFKSLQTSGVTVEYTVRKRLNGLESHVIRIPGNYASDLPAGKKIRIFGNADNDREYTISSQATYNGGITTIAVTEAIANPVLTDGVLSFIVNRPVVSLTNGTAGQNRIEISGYHAQDINPAQTAYVSENDGSQSRFITGGIWAEMHFEPLLDSHHNGTGFIQVFADYTLLHHPDSRVEWYKGTVRLLDVSGKTQTYPISYIGNLTNTEHNGFAFVIQDPGFVSGNPAGDIFTLNLNVSQEGNIHPSYRLYLRNSSGYDPVTGGEFTGQHVQFNEAAILPASNNPTEGNRQTYMSVRSYDVVNDLYSYLSSPSVLMAQQIIPPVTPAQPQGPFYATRPDVYGKSTYTFDTVANLENGRQPYAMVFYRAAHDKLLDTLYTKTKQGWIFQEWSNRPESFRYDPGLWNVLLNGIADPLTGEFSEYTTYLGSFQWPLPDNGDYYIPYQSPFPLNETNPAGGFYKPFALQNNFKLDQDITVYGREITGKEMLKNAILQAFIPLTEQPPVYAHIKSGKQTLSAPSVVRDTNGNLIDPIANDLYPMTRIYQDGDETRIRFTDYTLDGASTSLYFYCAAEMDSKLKLSDPSPVLGPVRMVDAFAPEQPQVRKTIVRLRDDYNEQTAAVEFDMIPFIASERISKMAIYRCTDETDALSIRTMQLVDTVPFDGVITDDFGDVPFPLYGEQLYYRLVAIREIMEPTDVLNTQTVRVVEIPSKPSEIIKTTLADNVNPKAPDLTFIIGESTEEAYEEVIVQWNATCYNGTYTLQKMNSRGNWNDMYQVNQKTGVMTYPPMDSLGQPDFVTYDKTASLAKKDEDGNTIYHRFRVVVENASGLFNLKQKEFICQEIDLTGEDFDNLGLEDSTGTIIY